MEDIKRMLKDLPPDFDKIRSMLCDYKPTVEELAEIAIDCTDECFCEYKEIHFYHLGDGASDNMHSDYIVDSLKLLLEFGLEPDTIIGFDNAMWNTIWIDAPNVGASALRLLLEHGGNPNHFLWPRNLLPN